MGALVFATAAKNTFLNFLTGKDLNPSPGVWLSGTVIIRNSGGTAIHSFTPTWGTVVAGVSKMNDWSGVAGNGGTAASVDFGINSSYIYASGVPSLTGGGGNVILSTLDLVTNNALTVAATMTMPADNGGTVRFSEAMRTAFLKMMLSSTLADQAACSMNSGVLTFYSSPQPATADTAVTTQSILGTFTVDGHFNLASGGSASIPGSSYGITVTGTGTATWARWVKGSKVIDFSVGTTGADIIVPSQSFLTGNGMTLGGLTLSLP